MNLSSAPAWTIPGRSSSQPRAASPGPGQYSPSIIKYEKSPCYRIGTSNRSTFAYSSTPGPGAYSPLSLKFSNTPSFSYGKGGRSEFITSQTPGPGTYLSKSFFATIGGKIGTANRSAIVANSLVPGPGSYSPASGAVEGPRYTISGRRPLTADVSMPGPGAYNVIFNEITTKEKSPSYRIGTAERTPINNSQVVPGPGNYNVGSTLHGPKWGFGRSERSNSKPEEVPGPGSYKPLPKSSGPACTIQGRYRPLSAFTTPGPGSYSESPIKGTAWSMGRSARASFEGKFKTPGPGTYQNYSSLAKNAAVFSKATRGSISHLDQGSTQQHHFQTHLPIQLKDVQGHRKKK